MSIEHIERQEKTEVFFADIDKVKPPNPYRNFKEWFAGLRQKYRSGFVVGLVLDESDPKGTFVYFDGNRRRAMENNTEGIIFEGIRVATDKIIREHIRVGDLVKINFDRTVLAKIATQDELLSQGVLFSQLSIDWEQVIGAFL